MHVVWDSRSISSWLCEQSLRTRVVSVILNHKSQTTVHCVLYSPIWLVLVNIQSSWWHEEGTLSVVYEIVNGESYPPVTIETKVKWKINMLCWYICIWWWGRMLMISFYTMLAVSTWMQICLCLVPHEEGLLRSTVAFLDSSWWRRETQT